MTVVFPTLSGWIETVTVLPNGQVWALGSNWGPGAARRRAARRQYLYRAGAAGRVDGHHVRGYQPPSRGLVEARRDLASGGSLDRRGGEPRSVEDEGQLVTVHVFAVNIFISRGRMNKRSTKAN